MLYLKGTEITPKCFRKVEMKSLVLNGSESNRLFASIDVLCRGDAVTVGKAKKQPASSDGRGVPAYHGSSNGWRDESSGTLRLGVNGKPT